LKLGVRPEHFDANGPVKVSIPVDVIEHLGGTSFAYGGGSSENPFTVELKDGRKIASGEVLKTGIDPDRAFLFEAGSGRRIR
jgi:lactose/L-arabinose transport system ATP-binding protein